MFTAYLKNSVTRFVEPLRVIAWRVGACFVPAIVVDIGTRPEHVIEGLCFLAVHFGSVFDLSAKWPQVFPSPPLVHSAVHSLPLAHILYPHANSRSLLNQLLSSIFLRCRAPVRSCRISSLKMYKPSQTCQIL